MTWRKGKGQAEGLFRTNTLTFFGHRSCCRNLVGCATDHRRDSGGKNYSSSAFITTAHLGSAMPIGNSLPVYLVVVILGRREQKMKEEKVAFTEYLHGQAGF